MEPRRTLLGALRHDLGLAGAKQACDMGNCGACTVLLDGRAVYACLQLTVDCAGRAVATIEGLVESQVIGGIMQGWATRSATRPARKA